MPAGPSRTGENARWPLSTMPTGPVPGAPNAAGFALCSLRASAADRIVPPMTMSAPRALAPGDAATRSAARRLAGPSQSGSDEGCIAPRRTTGLSEVSTRCRKNAVSSRVSVPWVTTRPSTSGRSSHAAARRARRHICSGVTCGPGSREKSSHSTSAIPPSSGTRATISRQPSAGTTAPDSSTVMEIVPPVKRMPIMKRFGRPERPALQVSGGPGSSGPERRDTSKPRRC